MFCTKLLGSRSVFQLAVAVALLRGGGACAQNAGQTPYTQWLMALHNTYNYTVTQGAAINFPGCANFVNYLGSCFGNNKLTPYVLINPPLGYSSLPTYVLNNFSTTLSSGVVTNDFYQLGPDEAIVTIITLPPQAAYYGFQTYMFQRPASVYQAIQGGTVPSVGTGTNPPVTTNCQPGYQYATGGFTHTLTYDCNYDEFGFFTNAINDAAVFNQYQVAFNTTYPSTTSTIAIVTTANSTMYGYIKGIYEGLTAGDPSGLGVFNEPMPAGTVGSTQSLLDIGTSGSSDSFVSLIRYALPDTNTAGQQQAVQAWSNGVPLSSVLVFRIKEPSLGSPVLYNAPGIVSTSQNTVETMTTGATCPIGSTTATSSPSYDCDIQEIGYLLKTYLHANLATASETYSLVNTGPASGVSGPLCIGHGTGCAGGTQDTDAYRNFQAGQLLLGYPVFFIGVNHSASAADPVFQNPPQGVTYSSPVNNASYTGVSIATLSDNVGVADVAQPNVSSTFLPTQETLSGSAAAVLTSYGIAIPSWLQADLPNLYIGVFYRNNGSNACSQPYCTAKPWTTLVQGASPSNTAGVYIPTNAGVLLTERGYLQPPATVPTSSPLPVTGATSASLQNPYVLCDTAAGQQCQ